MKELKPNTPARAVATATMVLRTIPPAFSLYIFSGDFLSAYRSFPEYPVTFYDINHFFMYAAYFIRVYSGEKVADCINFWNPSTDTVFQSFRHAFRGCMMLPGTILPPGMGVPFFIVVILRLYSVAGVTFPPDGLLLPQGRQCSFKFVTPL